MARTPAPRTSNVMQLPERESDRQYAKEDELDDQGHAAASARRNDIQHLPQQRDTLRGMLFVREMPQ